MKSKRKYYSEKLLQFQGDAKKTWRIMKEVIGKSKLIHCGKFSLIKMLSLRKSELQTLSTICSLILVQTELMKSQWIQDYSKATSKKLIKQ